MAKRPIFGLLGLVVAGLALTGCTPCRNCRDKGGAFSKGTPPVTPHGPGGITPVAGTKTAETKLDQPFGTKADLMPLDKGPLAGGKEGMPSPPPLPAGITPSSDKLLAPPIGTVNSLKPDSGFPVTGRPSPPVNETPISEMPMPPQPLRRTSFQQPLPTDTLGGGMRSGLPAPQPPQLPAQVVPAAPPAPPAPKLDGLPPVSPPPPMMGAPLGAPLPPL